MLDKGIGLLVLLVVTVSVTPAFALTELERTSMMEPRLENVFGAPIVDNVNVNQQVQISSDITNHQTKSQNFVYLVQIKDDAGFIVSLGWISGQLTPDQKLSPHLWAPFWRIQLSCMGRIAPNTFSNLGSIIDVLSNSVNAKAGVTLTVTTSKTNSPMPLSNTFFGHFLVTKAFLHWKFLL